MKLLIALLLISTYFHFSANAAVNMRNGAYVESWIDFIEPGEGYPLKIERFYSSRSLFEGIFGFGWCTEYETFLEVSSDGIINLTECGGGLEVTYYPDHFDSLNPSDTAQKIIKKMNERQKLTKSDINNLNKQLTQNSRLRFEYANKLHLVDVDKIKSKKGHYHAKSKALEKITYDGQSYLRKRTDGVLEKFNLQGKLIQITQSNGQFIKLNYKGPQLAYIVDNRGRRINFSYHPDGKLSKISNGRSLTAKYEFSGNNLNSVTNMWSKTYKYQFDNAHNLTHVQFPDNTAIKMTYDDANDWIKTYTNRKNCTESFEFTMSPKDPKNHYWGTVEKKCENKKVAHGKHEFWYKSFSYNKDKYLHRVLEQANKDFRDITYHPYLGRPLTIRDNTSYQGFAYFLNGLVNKKEEKNYTRHKAIENWSKSTFSYKPDSYLLTQSEVTRLSPKGKKTDKTISTFKYNGRGQLSSVKTSKGETVQVSYDSQGRLEKFRNHKNKEILLSYEDQSRRPSKITLPGAGNVTLKYNTEGDVANIESDNKRNIASSVIETFLSMIELLGPMGEELKL